MTTEQMIHSFPNISTYCDLCVPAPQKNRDRHLRGVFDTLIEFGYGACAVTTTVSGKITDAHRNATVPFKHSKISAVPEKIKKNKNKKENSSVVDINFSANTPEKLCVYSRITVDMTEPKDFETLDRQRDVLRTYDIVALRPSDERMFKGCCERIDVDVITFDCTTRTTFMPKPLQIKRAIENGVYFEITYGPSIRDTAARRAMIGNAINIIRATKGKNILISGEIEHVLELRGPYDMINFTSLFEMKQEAARKALSGAAREVLLHGHTRRTTANAAVSITSA
eukprot:CFRG3114T1